MHIETHSEIAKMETHIVTKTAEEIETILENYWLP